MPILNSIASWWMKKRMHQIELFMKYPDDVQNEWLVKLTQSAKDTEWGKKHDYKNIFNAEQFKNNVPLQDYDSLKPYFSLINNLNHLLIECAEENKMFYGIRI